MRAKTIEYVYTKEIIDVVDSGSLQVDTTNPYAANDYLHTGILVWNNVFPELYDSYIQVVKIEVLEQVRGTGNLLKPEIDLILFNKAKAIPSVSANSVFTYSDIFDDDYPLESNLQKISILPPDYSFEYIGTNTKDTKAVVTPQNLYFKSNQSQHLFGVALAKSSTSAPFASNVRFKILLWVKLL